MPAIDALLRVMTLRDADSIALVAGQPPALRRRGEREVMSMPALEPSLVAVFAEEVLADQHARLADAGRLEVSYRAADGPSYLVAVELASGELRLIARPAGRPPRRRRHLRRLRWPRPRRRRPRPPRCRRPARPRPHRRAATARRRRAWSRTRR